MAKEEVYKKNIEVLKFVVVAIIFLAILIVVYYFFVYTEKCENENCFNEHLTKCRKTKWLNDAEEATWMYTIKGYFKKSCEVEVKVLNIKQGKLDIKEAEGKSMNCYISPGIIVKPAENIEYCTGELKEEMQDIIIKRMHSYILENLGEISEELTKPMQNAT